MNATPLIEHIKQVHCSNMTAAAKALDTSRTSLYKWIGEGAIISDGVIYCLARKRNMGNKK